MDHRQSHLLFDELSRPGRDQEFSFKGMDGRASAFLSRVRIDDCSDGVIVSVFAFYPPYQKGGDYFRVMLASLTGADVGCADDFLVFVPGTDDAVYPSAKNHGLDRRPSPH